MRVDVHCYVGQWPFRRLADRTLDDVRGLLARVDTQRALLTPLAAIFHKDCLAAVRALHEELITSDWTEASLVAVINPAFPGWRADLDRMIADLSCVAVRLFPNYHGYRLMDPECESLLGELQDRSLPLILSPRIEDERLHHWLVKTPPVSRLDLRWLLRAFPNLKILLCHMTPDELDFLSTEILSHPSASIDTSARMPQFFMEEMVGQFGADRILYGSGQPLQYPECAVRMIRDAQLAEDDSHKIFWENALKLFELETSAGVRQ